MDFATLKTMVQRRLRDLPTETEAEIGQYINWAIHSLQVKHNYRCMERTQGATTDATEAPPDVILGNSFPGNWKAPRGRPWYQDGNDNSAGTTHHIIDWIFSEDLVVQLYDRENSSLKGRPRHIWITEGSGNADHGQNIEADFNEGLVGNQTRAASPDRAIVLPRPDGLSRRTEGSGNPGEYRIKLPYWGFLRDLVADGDRNWFTDFASEYIVMAATSRGFAMNWDEARSTYWLALAVAEEREIKSMDKGFQTALPGSLEPRVNVNKPTKLGRFRRR